MKDVRTLSELYDLIEKDYAWRITELSNYRSFVIQSKGKSKEPMLRAGVALLYAHWEGFIKNGADLYYSFVSNQSKKLNEYSNSFISISLRSQLETMSSTKKLSLHNSVIETFFDKADLAPNFSSSSPIRTSNLKFEIFEDVCLMLGIGIDEFHERYKRNFDRNIALIINEDLLTKRNKIAHGNYLLIDEKEFKQLYDVVINGLLYNFKELLMDCAQNKKYLK